jgi:DUF2958 family protein
VVVRHPDLTVLVYGLTLPPGSPLHFPRENWRMKWNCRQQKLRDSLPPLYAQDKVRDPVVHATFFTPDANWTWYVTEGEADKGDFRFFGSVCGLEEESDYFVLSELESVSGPLGLVERNLHFTPGPFAKVMADERRKAPIEQDSSCPFFTVIQTRHAVRQRPRAFRKALISFSREYKNSKKSTFLYLHVSETLRRIRYSSIPEGVAVPSITSRSVANALIACSALLLFHGTPS